MSKFVITGTDTDVGKTVFAAALAQALGAHYWKPIQAGIEDRTDSQFVAELGIPKDKILPEAYCLNTPCSPHEAAKIDGVMIDRSKLTTPEMGGGLVIEGAGGALVPVTDDLVFAELFAEWQLPVIIVASTRLGTINHSLLTIEALRHRGVPIHGIAFMGDAVEESESVIIGMGQVPRLGRLPFIAHLDAPKLSAAFAESFQLEDFT